MELKRIAEARRMAYLTYGQTDSKDGRVAFAKLLLDEPNNAILKAGETTTLLAAMDKEQNVSLEVLSIVSKQLESLSSLLKDAAKV